MKIENRERIENINVLLKVRQMRTDGRRCQVIRHVLMTLKNPKLTEPDVAEACCLVLLASDNMMLQCIQGYGRRGPGCCCYVYMKRLTPASSAFCM